MLRLIGRRGSVLTYLCDLIGGWCYRRDGKDWHWADDEALSDLQR